jgi:hypothetical protein
MATTSPTPILPFGKHKGQPLADVPGDYLRWALLTVKLSSGLRTAVADELTRRGVPVPDPPPPRVPPCPRCAAGDFVVRSQEDRLGRRQLRAECARCRKWLTYLPATPTYRAAADRASSPTAALDVLTRLDDLGIDLESDGGSVWVPWPAYRRVPADLQALIRQCSYQLAKLNGDTRKRRAT